MHRVGGSRPHRARAGLRRARCWGRARSRRRRRSPAGVHAECTLGEGACRVHAVHSAVQSAVQSAVGLGCRQRTSSRVSVDCSAPLPSAAGACVRTRACVSAPPAPSKRVTEAFHMTRMLRCASTRSASARPEGGEAGCGQARRGVGRRREAWAGEVWAGEVRGARGHVLTAGRQGLMEVCLRGRRRSERLGPPGCGGTNGPTDGPMLRGWRAARCAGARA